MTCRLTCCPGWSAWLRTIAAPRTDGRKNDKTTNAEVGESNGPTVVSGRGLPLHGDPGNADERRQRHAVCAGDCSHRQDIPRLPRAHGGAARPAAVLSAALAADPDEHRPSGLGARGTARSRPPHPAPDAAATRHAGSVARTDWRAAHD